ncbi:MAG: helix-turn-helix domain-containing protein [Acidimicrobiia bacterium]|nr:helix-turn-helix domain-containing protein [Acidimicrobiia bacterium]MYF83421.1 helix-turn-helix domain-containing protein [Acidimicrobiia bacterium]
MTSESVDLDQIIHQPVRLRIMTLLVSQPGNGRVAYTFIQRTLDVTGGNLTIHLRKLRDTGYVAITKEFRNEKPSTWVTATPSGRRAFADYLVNLEKVLNWVPPLQPEGQLAAKGEA